MSSDSNSLVSGDDMVKKPRKRKEKVVELIEVDGKRVSKTSTGKRKFHNKSKNGCDNCKRRRVKCDEGKPCCQKCINMKLECVYTPITQRKKRLNGETVVKYVTSNTEDDRGVTNRRNTVNGSTTEIEESPVTDVTRKSSMSVAELQRHQHSPQRPNILHQRQHQQHQQHQQQQQQQQQGGTPGPESLLLPPLLSGSNMQHLQQQIQQQPQLLPQLMTLSNSEKFAAFDFPTSPPPQSTSMNITNSISSIFAANKFPTNLLNNLGSQQQSPSGSISQSQDMLSQLSKMGINLKQMGMLPTAGIGGITYDFQELLGMKSPLSGANTKTSNSVGEVLTSLQHAGTTVSATAAASVSTSETLNPNATTNLENNPTISPTAPMSPMAKALNGASELSNDIETARAAAKSNSDTIDSKVMGKSETQESSTSTAHSHQGSIFKLIQLSNQGNLNFVDLKLFHHYSTKVWPTITAAGISEENIWSDEIPQLAFEYPFLMHALLAFSATHLSRTESGLEHYVASHRLDALRLLREAVLEISEDNTDALVASALILIMDSLANASSSNPTIPNSMSPSAWIFHVKGAATILTAVWPLTEKSRFYNLISVDLSDLGDVINQESGTVSELVCFDESIADLYPVEIDSPYLITLAYLDKLHREKNQSDFILRIFAFPALLDKTFLALLMTGDLGAMRIMRSYYKLLRGFATEVKDKVWFLEGVSQVLPQDVDDYSGGGGMHMMLDFLGGGLPSMTTTNLQPGLSDFM